MWDKLNSPLLQGEHMAKTTVCLSVNYKKPPLLPQTKSWTGELVSMPCIGFQSLLYPLCIGSLHKQWWPPNNWGLASPVQRYAPDPSQVNEIVWHSARLGKTVSLLLELLHWWPPGLQEGRFGLCKEKKSEIFRKIFLMTLSIGLEPALLLDSYKFQEGRDLS